MAIQDSSILSINPLKFSSEEQWTHQMRKSKIARK